MRRLWCGVLILTAASYGLSIALIDISPNWDDTGISAAAVVFGTILLGMIRPARPWVWALAVGGWIPLFNILRDQNYSVLFVLVFSFAGAYMGAYARKVLLQMQRTS